MDFLESLAIPIITTVVGGLIVAGIIAKIKNNGSLRKTLSEWTCRGIKVIYIAVPRDEKTTTLWLYLCGEEKSWLFPNISDKDCNSYFLAMKPIYYDSDGHRDEEYMAKWNQMDVQPLCDWIKEHPGHLVQLTGESKVLFAFSVADNDETLIVRDSFKFKDELDECLKKYKIKYFRRPPNAIDRWKIEPRYPT